MEFINNIFFRGEVTGDNVLALKQRQITATIVACAQLWSLQYPFLNQTNNPNVHVPLSGVNVQPDPVKFVQLTAPYWKDYVANWTMLG